MNAGFGSHERLYFVEAVVFIHSNGVIHSDLAARQSLLDIMLHVKLGDFGFSSSSDRDDLDFENLFLRTPATSQY